MILQRISDLPGTVSTKLSDCFELGTCEHNRYRKWVDNCRVYISDFAKNSVFQALWDECLSKNDTNDTYS